MTGRVPPRTSLGGHHRERSVPCTYIRPHMCTVPVHRLPPVFSFWHRQGTVPVQPDTDSRETAAGSSRGERLTHQLLPTDLPVLATSRASPASTIEGNPALVHKRLHKRPGVPGPLHNV